MVKRATRPASDAPSPGSRTGRSTRARSAAAKEKVRNVLIAAGRQLFQTLDFTEVSLRLIAKQAGYTPGVVYKHFPDRDTLFRAIRDAELEPYMAELKSIYDAETDPTRRILKMTEFATSFSTQMVRTFGSHFIYINSSPDNFNNNSVDPTDIVDKSIFTHKIYEIHLMAIEAFLDQFPRRIVDPEAAALSLIAAIASMTVLPGSIGIGPLRNRARMTRGMIHAMLFYWSGGSADIPQGPDADVTAEAAG